MAIKLRRGLEIDRMPIVFAQGEIVYVTDTKKVYIGDGVTYGGNLVTGEELLSALDDVQLTSLSNDDVLIYDSATSRWKNRSFSTRVRDVVLTGLSVATNAVIAATDSVLVALGKLQAQITAHIANTSNPHSVTKAQVGLSNVDNTSDANKPVSTATQTALNAKENTITAGTTSQYYRGDKTFQTLDKAAVGLSNVDNTSDANKPVSTATQTALNAKQDTLVSGTNIKTINGLSVLGAGNLVTSVPIAYRHDFNVFDYLGKAPAGSLDSDNVWTITRLTIASDGTATVGTAVNVSWTGRYTHIYT
jgi:hypothetical protein